MMTCWTGLTASERHLVIGELFVDTSALYAIHDRDDRCHRRAAEIWSVLLDAVSDGQEISVLTHSSVLVETSALVQRRLGIASLRDLHNLTIPLLDVVWVDSELHARAVSALLAAGRKDVSLVDWTSFELMRSVGVSDAFAFDDDFEQQGFRLISAESLANP